MIHTSVFCPFERTAAVLINKAKEAGVSTIKICFDNFRDNILMSTDKIDQNLGFTDAQKVLFLTQEEVTGSVTFVEASVTRRFKVCNVLATTQPLKRSYSFAGKQGLYNGEDALGQPIAFEEAATTTAGVGPIVAVDPRPASLFESRPLLQYVLVATGEDGYIIYGPKAMKPQQVYGYITINGKNYDLVRDSDIIFREDAIISEETKKLDSTVPSDFYVRYKFNDRDYLVPVIFGQINYAINGKRLSGITMLSILQCLVYQELFDNKILEYYDNKPVFDIRVRKDMWELSTAFNDNILDPYVTANEVVSNLFKNFEATNSGIVVRKDENSPFAPIFDKNGTAACFALTFAKYMFATCDRSWVSLISAINVSLETGMIAVNSSGKLEGQFSKNEGKEFNFDIQGSTGLFRITHLQRTVVYSKPNEDEYCMVGFDYKDNEKDGIPGHYILVKALAGRLIMQYDPAQVLIGIEPGRDITDYLLNRNDLCFITFNGNKVALSEGGSNVLA